MQPKNTLSKYTKMAYEIGECT